MHLEIHAFHEPAVRETYSVDVMIWYFLWDGPLGGMCAKSPVKSWNNCYYEDYFRVKHVLQGDI